MVSYKKRFTWINPQGFTTSGGSHLFCRLRCSLYDLKQSPHVWFDHFNFALLLFGMTRCEADNFVFSLHSPSDLCIYLVVYVDDIVITNDDFVVSADSNPICTTNFRQKTWGRSNIS